MSERFPRTPNSTPEHAVGARFSFANSQIAQRIGLRDYTIGILGVSHRIINYRDTNEAVRTQLEDRNLVLGKRSSGNVYQVPRSARPLAYEAAENKGGLYSYNDENLLYDLGVLLGGVAYSGETQNTVSVLTASSAYELAQMIALVDFTRPDEGNLFLMPGSENAIAEIPAIPDGNVSTFYDKALQEIFTTSYQEHGFHFHMGFNEQAGV